jgi:flavin-dependent dehydrogenase
MALPTQCDIAIIGAAPVGLFLANQPASPAVELCC